MDDTQPLTRRAQVIDAAERLLEADGPAALTMRAIAEAVGIRAPSLYKHFADRHAIEAALQERAFGYLAVALAAAEPDLVSTAAAYRRWALERPRLYDLIAHRPIDRALVSIEAESAAADPLMRATRGDLVVAQGLWGLAHGLVDLELSGRFPAGSDIDAVWTRAVAAFEAAITSA